MLNSGSKLLVNCSMRVRASLEGVEVSLKYIRSCCCWGWVDTWVTVKSAGAREVVGVGSVIISVCVLS